MEKDNNLLDKSDSEVSITFKDNKGDIRKSKVVVADKNSIGSKAKIRVQKDNWCGKFLKMVSLG